MYNLPSTIRGCYLDVMTDLQGRLRYDSGWCSNLIVRNCGMLLAALMKRTAGMKGILYYAVGEGKDGWDTSETTASSNTTKLKNEITRFALAEDQIVFLPNKNEPPGTLSNRLEITIELKGEDLISNGSLTLREFGLFGGDASDSAGSGLMINYVIHPRIDLTPDSTLTRKLRLTFSTGVLEEEEIIGFGAALPVYCIDGAGKKIENILNGLGVQSVGDLSKIDPLQSIEKIPFVKLRELRAKARMVMGFKATLSPFVPLAEYSISDILLQKPENLTEIIGLPDINAEMVARFQEELALLQIALDEKQLQNIKLKQLIEA